MTIGTETALLFAVLFLPGMIAQGGAVDPRSFENVLYHVQILAVAVPQILLVVAVSDLRRSGSSQRLGWVRPSRTDIVPGIAGLLAVWAVVGLVSLLASVLPGPEGALEPTVDWSFSRPELVPLALVSTLAIGYREELFYRAYLTDRAEEAGVDPRLALAAGAVVFAVGHLYQGVMGFAVALAIGLVLGEIFYRTRSLHGIAIAHGIYNLSVLLASGAGHG